MRGGRSVFSLLKKGKEYNPDWAFTSEGEEDTLCIFSVQGGGKRGDPESELKKGGGGKVPQNHLSGGFWELSCFATRLGKEG